MDEKIGIVTTYFAKIGLAAIRLTDGDLQVGDRVRIVGHTTEITQMVESLQIEHQNVEIARRGSQAAHACPRCEYRGQLPKQQLRGWLPPGSTTD